MRSNVHVYLCLVKNRFVSLDFWELSILKGFIFKKHNQFKLLGHDADVTVRLAEGSCLRHECVRFGVDVDEWLNGI